MLGCLVQVRCTAGGVLLGSLGTPSFDRLSEIAAAVDIVNAVSEGEAARSG